MTERADQSNDRDERATAPPDAGGSAIVTDTAEPSPEDQRVAELMTHTIDVPVLAEAVQQQDAPDAADTLEDLQEEEAADVLVAMDDEAAAEALAEMQAPLAIGLLEEMLEDGEVGYAARLLGLMAPDDAADLLQDLDEIKREQVYRAMPGADARTLRRLVGYDEDTAAGLMTTDFVTLRDQMTVDDATETIRAGTVPVHAYHLPIVDDTGRLVGLIDLRAMLISPGARRIADLMDASVRAVRANLDQEAVAREFDRYDFYTLPVVDESDRLLGIITVDDVIDIIREEQTEDVQKTVGAGREEAVYSTLSEKLRGRFPWLIASLVLTCFAALVVIFFEELIQDWPILAFLMPVIAALTGNAGHQALAVTLRGIVLDQVRRDRVWPLVLRETTVGVLNGFGLGILMCLIMALLGFFVDSAGWEVGALAGISLVVSMAVGTLAGSAIPLLMRRWGADPAQSSAIFLIMVTDAVSFSAFLGFTSFAIRWFNLTGPPL